MLLAASKTDYMPKTVDERFYQYSISGILFVLFMTLFVIYAVEDAIKMYREEVLVDTYAAMSFADADEHSNRLTVRIIVVGHAGVCDITGVEFSQNGVTGGTVEYSLSPQDDCTMEWSTDDFRAVSLSSLGWVIPNTASQLQFASAIELEFEFFSAFDAEVITLKQSITVRTLSLSLRAFPIFFSS
jgi:hypothetical protein